MYIETDVIILIGNVMVYLRHTDWQFSISDPVRWYWKYQTV